MKAKKVLMGFSLTMSFVLTSCSSVQGSGDFGCKATAFDSCLSIEEVDAMTSFADNPYLQRRTHHQSRGNTRHSYNPSYQDKTVWLIPKLNQNARGIG